MAAVPNMVDIWIETMDGQGLGAEARVYAKQVMDYYNANKSD